MSLERAYMQISQLLGEKVKNSLGQVTPSGATRHSNMTRVALACAEQACCIDQVNE